MDVTSDRTLDDGVRERRFTLTPAGDPDGIPGILWTSGPGPLVLLGHPGGLDRMYPRLLDRARDALAAGFTAATLELPGCGDRRRAPDAEAARADLRRAILAGEKVPDETVDRLVLPLVDAAVPEHRAALDALLTLPGLHGPVGLAGGNIAIGVRMAVVEPRLAAAVLFAGSRIPRRSLAEARTVAVPLHVLLQWDDEDNDRQEALDLFDALGSAEKTLHATTGGHTGVPRFAGRAANDFLARHLSGSSDGRAR
ncbi:dienelactone hydrolase family protein [Pseudonocardia oroxyli]|uniref:Dienelactone hydrolase n=1 Tax=Pseudonocardia oroxyli TaxID=366584 RepID=A0A1G7I435_PSEOR|nr:alpha/beta hydrolase [Pseudonocardia oroxyli]SDF07547.1 hypothetical protein SAMN05216377_103205 [Pseudonocardia oroxyli]